MTLHRVFRRSPSRVPVELGAHKKLCVEGCLAAGVLIAKKALYLVEVKQLPRLKQRIPKVLKTWSECVTGNLAVLRKMSLDLVNTSYFTSSMRFFAGEGYEYA